MTINIKRLKPKDIKLFNDLIGTFRIIFEEHSTSEQPENEYLKKLLSNNNIYILVALENEVVIGGLSAYTLDMYMKNEKEMYLYDIGITKENRGRGIGTQLIKNLINIASKENVSTIFVEAHKADIEAVEFYKSLKGELEEVMHFNFNIK